MIVALLNRKSDVGKTTPGWPRQRLRVVVIDADRKGENENCWLDWSEQRANKGLTRLFEVIGLAPGAPRLEALEIACMVGHVVTDGPPRFAGRTRSALLATDVALTPFQPSPSGEGASGEIRKLLEKAWIFRPKRKEMGRMDDLTEVELYWQKGRVERWIRFGQVTRERVIDRRRRIVSFPPGSIFAFVRWAANEHGTIASRIDILRAPSRESQSRRSLAYGLAAKSCSGSPAGRKSNEF